MFVFAIELYSDFLQGSNIYYIWEIHIQIRFPFHCSCYTGNPFTSRKRNNSFKIIKKRKILESIQEYAEGLMFKNN